MTYVPINYMRNVTYDASHRQRVSQLTTLFDGKALSADEGNLWENYNSGASSGTFLNNLFEMNVTGPGYYIRQGRYYNPYFSGKSQMIEMTFDRFEPQDGVVKRAGYFSSNTVAPFENNKDGIYLESVNNTVSLNIANNGSIFSIPRESWSNANAVANYDWSGFTVVLIDFLWLGGAVARLFIKTKEGFVLAHVYNYAGSGLQGTFMLSPQQPVRFELRCSSGSGGKFRPICCQVASEGSLAEVTQSFGLYTSPLITCLLANTTYVLKGARPVSAYKDQCFFLTDYSVNITSGSGHGMATLHLEPTATSTLGWQDTNRLQEMIATGQALSYWGTVLDAMPVNAGSVTTSFTKDNILCRLSESLGGGGYKLILAYTPYTANQIVSASMNFLRN